MLELSVDARRAGEIFARAAVAELRQQLSAQTALGINPEHSIAWRIKTPEAIKAKVQSSLPREELLVVNDFIGIRVLAGHSGCLDKVTSEISAWAERNELSEVRRENQFGSPDKSGYQAIHIDYEFRHPHHLRLPPQVGVEVQITTWLQQLHSMIAHRVYYKSVQPPVESVLVFLRELSAELSVTDAHLAEFMKSMSEQS